MTPPNTNTQRISTIGAALIGLALLCLPIVSLRAQEASGNSNAAQNTNTDAVTELNQQIDAKKQELADLQSRSVALQQAVDQASAQVHDIASQVALISAQVAQTNFAIGEKQNEIDTLNLEMKSIQQSIDAKTADIQTKKSQLAEALRQLDSNTRVSTLALVITQENLSEFYSQAQAITALTGSIQDGIQAVDVLRDELQARQDELVKTRDTFQQSKLQLEVQKSAVVDQQSLKTQLLSSAQQTQQSYQSQIEEMSRQEKQANATINALDQQIREELARKNGNTSVPIFSSTGYIWPAKGPITAYFHDPSYPFRRLIGDHTAIDIGIPQGTPVKATADGIVSVVQVACWGTPNQGFYTNGPNCTGQKTKSALSYVSIVHGTEISSRYLHLSAVYVHVDEFVRQGEVIGLSGGLPGTGGAGTTTTGAHLHFEIRSEGIPDDPLRYLP